MVASKREWRAESLGAARELDLPQGRLRYHSVGSGPAVVFVHGALVNANLWRKVVANLSAEHRCIALDLPLGSHLVPMPPAADLSPSALADLIADAIAALELDDVTLVGNDTGGALCQLVVTRRPERVGALVLTSCDAFDNFPPKGFRPFIRPLLAPGALLPLLTPGRFGPVQRLIFSTVTTRPVERAALDSYTLPALADAGVRRDLKKLLRGVDSSYTLEAAERLPGFDKPALIAWSTSDRFFPRSHAERLAALLPQGRLEWIEDARTFSPEDQPERLAQLIGSVRRQGDGLSAAAAAR